MLNIPIAAGFLLLIAAISLLEFLLSARGAPSSQKDFDCAADNLARAPTSNAHDEMQSNHYAHDDVMLCSRTDGSSLYAGCVKVRSCALDPTLSQAHPN